jgi:hypothetical protein
MAGARTENPTLIVEAHRETVQEKVHEKVHEETPEGLHIELATSLLPQAQSAVSTNSEKIRMKKV